MKIGHYENRIKKHYQRYFDEMGIDGSTGFFKNFPNIRKKFATYPHIGSNYAKVSPKLMFVSLDIGSQSGKNLEQIESFSERRESVEIKAQHRSDTGDEKIHCTWHIAGAFVATVKLLEFEQWTQVKRASGNIGAVKEFKELNPLARVSLTNYYKFVTPERSSKHGPQDRFHFNKRLEDQLLLNEISCLDAEVVVFQGSEFEDKEFADTEDLLFERVKEIDSVRQVFFGPHPSAVKYHQPGPYAESLEEWGGIN